jgi:hypothetical protein
MANRRVVVHPNHAAYIAGYKRALRDLRGELYAADFETKVELKRVQIELNEARAAFDELRAAVLARQPAEVELAELRRLREIGRARAAERDPDQPLH